MGLFGNGQGLQFGKSKPGENHRLSPANKGKECYFIEKKEEAGHMQKPLSRRELGIFREHTRGFNVSDFDA